jgi:MYXO-CTERM domain-containing protein
MRGGAVVCAPARDDVGPCVCRGVACEPACDGVVCSPGTFCDPFDPSGRCVEDSCRTRGCPSGEVCDDRGECVPDPCSGVSCEPGEVCRDGACVPDPCSGVTCEPGERCVDGTCRPGGGIDGGTGAMDAGRDRDRVLAAGGCACRASGPPSGGGLGAGLLMVVVLGLVLRRRRPRVAGSARALLLGLVLVLGGCDVEPFCLDCDAPPDGGLDAGPPDAAPVDAPEPCRAGSEERCNGRDDDCDELVDEGFDLTSSLEHCGACERPCAPVGAFGRCEASVCRVEACDVGRVDLDGDEANGCEYACARVFDVDALCDGFDDDCDGRVDEDVDVTRDPAHCGRCGQVCAFANAEARCVARACVLEACAPGFYDLDGRPESGCEYACTGTPGSVEACNGIDDDCDGAVDEAVTPPSGLCRSLGACAGAEPVCMGVLGFRCAYGPDVEVDPLTGQPVARETRCDGADGNCNGAVDEAFRTLGNACTGSGIGACRTTGRIVCSPDGTAAVCDAPAAPEPGAEVCNGVDDDCDGAVDEPRSSPGAGPSFVTTPWVEIAPGTWMMQYEASRPDATASAAGALAARACARPDVLPWTNVRYADALAACTAFGARLCTEAELTTACRGAGSCTWAWQPDCNAYSTSACNTSDRTEPDRVVPTGSLLECRATTAGGPVYDLSGNVKELAAARSSGAIPVSGGSYNQTGWGARCGFDWQVVSSSFRFENVGFRCCFSGSTPP